MASHRRAKKKNPARTHTAAQVAEILDLKPDLIRDYAHQGCPHDAGGPGRPNRFDPAEVQAWRQANNKTGVPGRPSKKDPTLDEARLRKEAAMARNWELRNAALEGEYVPFTDVQKWVAEKLTVIKSRLIALAPSLAVQLEGMDASERHSRMEESFATILNELADGFRPSGKRLPEAAEEAQAE